MIEPSANTNDSKPQIKMPQTENQLKTSVNVLGGIITGIALGQITNSLLPIQQDVFTKTESNLLKLTTPEKHKEWGSLVNEIIKSRRSVKYNTIGAIVGGIVALCYSLRKNSQTPTVNNKSM